MDRESWARIQRIFHLALERPAEARAAFVEAECAAHPDEAARVFALLAEDAKQDLLIDRELAQVAGAVLDGSVPLLTHVGPYRVLRVLGQGGMGVVYLGEREDLGVRAAIKVLRDAALSPARRERFRAEQRLLAQLVHPRIGRLYDASVLPDGTPYFVMEYVEGRALDVYCREEAPSLAERLRLFREICDAVRFAHGRAVIHRDLKPSNVLVDASGAPMLLDFGIAKHLDSLQGAEAVTRTGLQLMTPAYAAPEQLQGDAVGVFTDVYALGALLYQMLTGRAPFDLDRLTPAQAERRIVETTPSPPSGDAALSTLDRTSAADLDVLCATAMHHDPERRYSSVEALIRDVDHFRAGEALEARPDTVGYRLRKFARRRARELAVAGAVVLGLAGTVSYYTLRLAQARDRAVAEAERTRRIQTFTQNLFAGGDDAVGPSDTLRVLTLLARGVQEARLLADDPAQQAEMYLTLGTIHAQLGRYAEADTLLQAALSWWRERADAESTAEALTVLGDLRTLEGAYDEADTLLAEALRLRQAQGVPDPVRVALTRAALGRALEGRGEYDAAIAHLDDAVATLERLAPSSPDLSDALGALANTHFYAGDLDASDSVNLRALALDRRLHGERHPTVADGLINLAVAEFQRGRYAEGEPLLRDAVGIFESYHGPEHPQTASALRMLGQNLIYQGRLGEAEPLLRRALAVGERALPANHPRLANTLGDLAYIDLQNGRYDEAVASYRRIVDIYRATNGERHYFVAIGLSNLANALMEGGRHAEAAEMFSDVVQRMTETRGADHLDTGIARIKLGHALLGLARVDSAEVELRAGYDLVSAASAPTVSWLRAARRDLVDVYTALGRPDEAERFRAEQAQLDAAAANAANGSGG
ncbi:MAG: tetratricopeptide repeat protein [Gemmatimonadota bacterium]|nr:tetratricopeptide repeat protein [Gemmatimonadota bacterium]